MLVTNPKLELAQKIVDLYGLEIAQIHVPQTGYRNQSFQLELTDGSLANLMVYKAEPDILSKINQGDAVSTQLDQHGLPVRTRLDSRLIKLVGVNDIPGYAALYNYLPGQTITWDGYTMNHLKLLGWAMGRMHGVLREFNQFALASAKPVQCELEALVSRMQSYLMRQPVTDALQAKLGLRLVVAWADFLKALQLADNLKLQCGLHMDLVRGNVLFSDTADTVDSAFTINNLTLSGLIDFEKASHGSPLFDLARTYAFLLVDCKYKTTEQIRKYFLYSGYMKRGHGQIPPATSTWGAEQLPLLEIYTRLFLLHDFYKFLRHNPYEYLAQNQHFIRTRDILVDLGMLKYSHS